MLFRSVERKEMKMEVGKEANGAVGNKEGRQDVGGGSEGPGAKDSSQTPAESKDGLRKEESSPQKEADSEPKSDSEQANETHPTEKMGMRDTSKADAKGSLGPGADLESGRAQGTLADRLISATAAQSPQGKFTSTNINQNGGAESRPETTRKIIELMHVIEFMREEPNANQSLLSAVKDVSAVDLESVLYFGVMLTTPNGPVPHEKAVRVSLAHCQGYLNESQEEAFTGVKYCDLVQMVAKITACPLLKNRGLQSAPVADAV